MYNALTPGFNWKSLNDGSLSFAWWATSPASCGGLIEYSNLQSVSTYQNMFAKWQGLNNNNQCTNGGDKISLWQYCAACNGGAIGSNIDLDITTQAVVKGGNNGHMVRNWAVGEANPKSLQSWSGKITGDTWDTTWSSGSPAGS